jgi:ubiquinone/menaquinone biosynthesis C-methylase UbiE
METRYDSWAGVYDSIYSYVREDIPFYVEAAQAVGGPVLELGCGTGRVTMPIAEAGVDVVGLDSSAAMLDVARRKLGSLSPGSGSVTLVEGDMAELPGAYDRKFSLAIIPFRGFLSLMTVPKQESALEGIRRSLVPGGRLVFNVFVPDLEMLVQEGDTAHHLRDVTDPETGDRFVIWHQSGYDNHNQVIFVRLIVDQLDAQDTAIKRFYRDYHLRYVHRWEMHHLLLRCGFEVLDLFGDFQGSEFDETSGEMVWVASPPTAT